VAEAKRETEQAAARENETEEPVKEVEAAEGEQAAPEEITEAGEETEEVAPSS
jgi:hypothetical protein